MTTAPPPNPPQPNRKRLRALLIVLLFAGLGFGAYLMWRPEQSDRPTIPEIDTRGLDAEVAAVINQARADVEAQPTSAAAWGRLGMVLFAQDMYADCIGILAEAERLDPNDPRWPYLCGLAQLLHKPDEGIVYLQRAAAMSPQKLPFQLRLAEEYLKLDRLDEAEVHFAALLEEYRDNPRALLGRGLILSRRGRWREALTPLQAAAEDPTSAHTARVALAEAYLRLDDKTAAAAQRERAAAVRADIAWPDPILAAARELRTGLQPRIDQTLSLLRNGQVQEAEDLSREVLLDHPESDEAHLTRAKVLIRRSAFAEAESALRQALALNANLVDGHFLLAGIRMQTKDYPAAEPGYRRTIELKPTHGLAHYLLGDCRLKQGDKIKAMEAFRNALRYRPDLAIAYVELGALLLEEGKIDEAIAHLDDAIRLDDKNERARTLLAQARAKKKL